jgi:osmotically-inducible protein OsmY
MRRGLLVLALAGLLLPALQGCVPVVAGAAVGSGVLIADDRRSGGAVLDDQGIELKMLSRIEDSGLGETAHVNVTSFNRVVLLTGEAPSAEGRERLKAMAEGIAGVRIVQDELVVGPPSSLADRTQDTYLTSKVKARFVEAGEFSANHVKVVTEAGVVYLMGLVRRAEATSASNLAARTAGVRKVVQVFEYLD